MRDVIMCVTLLAGVACAGPSVEVKRLDTRTVTDLSGRWNDTDARLTSEQLIDECFASRWLPAFADGAGRRPAVRVRGVSNRTDEHIDAQVFIKSIERAMVNSGRVKVLAQEGSEMRVMESEQERSLSGRQAMNTPVSVGSETGADYVVAVRLASVLDQVDGQRAKLYQVDFELISPSTGEKAWIGEHQIKKLIRQDRVSW